MPDVSLAPGARKPEARSRISNGKALHLFGDGRSRAARRYRDVLDELVRPHGGLAALAEPMRQIARRAAALSIQAELLEAAMARGETIDPVAFATIANTLSRLLARLEKARPAAKAPGQLFDEHVARLAREEAS